jgi:hypothetical protein
LFRAALGFDPSAGSGQASLGRAKAPVATRAGVVGGEEFLIVDFWLLHDN